MCKSMIPKKTLGLELASGDISVIDTNCLDCTMSVYTGEVYVKTEKDTSDNEAFIVKAGQELCFCGKVFVKAKTSSNVRAIMFDRL